MEIRSKGGARQCPDHSFGTPSETAQAPQDDEQSVAAIHRALELGVNWIDTAAVYGLGHSEEAVARALAGWRGPRPYKPQRNAGSMP